jgi:hypothetical protein
MELGKGLNNCIGSFISAGGFLDCGVIMAESLQACISGLVSRGKAVGKHSRR